MAKTNARKAKPKSTAKTGRGAKAITKRITKRKTAIAKSTRTRKPSAKTMTAGVEN